ncbi:hypothetical protein [Pyrococcus yayanosii]|uniref:ABC-2 type transport system permease protein n=1 Tax=Pyrococcus yayanosii (strain CH1 / JCM 16557) TaxID=529709 RepID=F8AFB8_PYRYC|nr:hypothetical protein [Pyrococcus yayanosii]AEH24951.1 hypothetical protein PYCH_12790 [Pyrococcus yayanosii CH1]
MKHIALEIRSNPGIIALMVLAPSLILYVAWNVFLNLDMPSDGGAELAKAVPSFEVERALSELQASLGSFIQDVAIEQSEAFGRGIKTTLIGVFLVMSILTALTFGKAISTGTIIHDIGLVRDRRKVFIFRLAPLIIYSILLASILTIGLASIFPLTGVDATKSDIMNLLIALMLSSFWGIFLSAILSTTSKEYAYSILGSFAVAGIFLAIEDVGEVLFPFFKLLIWLSSSGQEPMGSWATIGLSLFILSPALALRTFERGDYY